ncbi:MAG: class I adenylate-forming enzyme family protein, partial [Novosphingobium sp.]|nr:class I adenylate-forming enzyme family protein [Novosphingobium sp.]
MGYARWAEGLRHETHHERVVLCHKDRPANIAAMFDEAVARRGGEVALVDGGLRLTWREVADRADRCATHLLRLGLGRGDRIVILLDNRADYTVLLVAAARIGAISVPANIRQRAPETAYVLDQCEAAAIIYEDGLAEYLPPAAGCPSVRHWLPYSAEAEAWTQTEPDRAALAACAPVDEDDPFCILYTSGTTGKPKGAVLTHFGVVTSCIGSADHLRLRDGDAMILSVPASHVTGVVLVLLLAVRIAGKVVSQRGFKARAFLELAERERMNYAIMVPAMYKLCLMEPGFAKFDLSSWRIGGYGGAPMPAATIEELAGACPQLTLVNIYGSTETTSPAVMMPLGEGRERLDVVGKALPYCQLIVVDEEGRQLPPGEQGEIWIGG